MNPRLARLSNFLVACAALGAAVTACRPAAAGSFDFLFNMNAARDDHQFFLNLSVGDSGIDRRVLEPALPRLRNVEVDLPVVLFLARESRRPVDSIISLRAGGMSWSAVFQELRVPPDVLFVGMDRDPGPPYGKAWGYWKKHPRGARFPDRDIASLVEVQVGHRLTGASPYDFARARARGKPVAAFVSEKKGRSHKGGPPSRGRADSQESGHGGGKSKEHGHGHGHGKPH